ncbi:MAG: MBOAT family protein, partial [Dysgonamonadaceae bacterium]|nr:MBOAT family protein [Dysgonamonadaceae bacterium]
MLFNSFLYLVFFPTVCLIYWLLPHKYRSVFLLITGYVFYMNWEPVYALLLLFITLVSWLCGIFLEKKEKKKKRKIIFITCLAVVLGILFIFKYSGFISGTVNDLLSYLHISFKIPFLKLLLPVGISFYTFQASAYIIDVYKEKIKAERNIFIYALFVSFFPQLLAG